MGRASSWNPCGFCPEPAHGEGDSYGDSCYIKDAGILQQRKLRFDGLNDKKCIKVFRAWHA